MYSNTESGQEVNWYLNIPVTNDARLVIQMQIIQYRYVKSPPAIESTTSKESNPYLYTMAMGSKLMTGWRGIFEIHAPLIFNMELVHMDAMNLFI